MKEKAHMTSRPVSMDRISLKTIAKMFPVGDPARVYLHGKWQIDRGRNPSLQFGDYRTPKEAYKALEAALDNYFNGIRQIPFSRHHGFWTPEEVSLVREDTAFILGHTSAV